MSTRFFIKYIVIIGLFIGFVGVPVAHAALTENQIQAILNLLQSFGAEQSVVSNVNSALRGQSTTTTGTTIPTATTTPPTVPFVNPFNPFARCLTLTRTLSSDDTDAATGGAVSELQRFLRQDSSIYPEGLVTGFFGPATERAVQRFQSRAGIISSGAPDTTGYGAVGPATRARMARACEAYPFTSPGAETPGPFTITFPTSGAALMPGLTYNITWSGSYPGVSSYAVYLVGGTLGTTGSRSLGNVAASQGYFSWSVPSDVTPGSGFQIQLSGAGASGGNSPSFSIIPPPTQQTASCPTTYSLVSLTPVVQGSGSAGALGSATVVLSGRNPGTFSISLSGALTGTVSGATWNNHQGNVCQSLHVVPLSAGAQSGTSYVSLNFVGTIGSGNVTVAPPASSGGSTTGTTSVQPSVTSISPSSGTVRAFQTTIFTIFGSGFDSNAVIQYSANNGTSWLNLPTTFRSATALDFHWIGGVAQGTYLVRVQNLSNLLTPYSNSVFYTILPVGASTSPPTRAVTINVSPTSVAPSGTVTVTWNFTSGQPTGSNDWFGIYEASEPLNSTRYQPAWFYNSGATSSGGSRTMAVPTTPGTYHVRYLLNGGYESAGISNTFTVGTSVSPAQGTGTLRGYLDGTNPSTLNGWACLSGSSAQLPVTLYFNGAYPTNVTANVARIEPGFLQNSGGCPDIYHGFELPLSLLALPAGTYTISARAQHPVTAQTITLPLVGAATTVTIPASGGTTSSTRAVTVNVSPASVLPGGTITVGWHFTSGQPMGPNDWFAIYSTAEPDRSTRYQPNWAYNSSASPAGDRTMIVPTTPGTYHVRYLLNGGYDLSAGISNTFTVSTTTQPATGGTTQPATGGSTTPTLHGYLDGINYAIIRGWACLSGSPAQPPVTLYFNGAYPTNVTTNSARTESGFLQNSGGCPDIYHGFELSLSQLALPAGTYTISARAQHPVTAQTITLPLSGSLATTVTIPASGGTTTQANTTPPQSLSYSGGTCTGSTRTGDVFLSWQNPSTVSTQNTNLIWIERGVGGATPSLFATASPTATSFNDHGAIAYPNGLVYRIRYSNLSGVYTGYSNEITVPTCQAATPTTNTAPPASLVAEGGTCDTGGRHGSVTLRWSNPSSATSANTNLVRLERSAGSGSFGTLTALGFGPTTFSDGGAVSYGDALNYRAYYQDYQGNTTGFSNTATMQACAAPPVSATPTLHGYLDGINYAIIRGWACLSGSPAQPPVTLYFNGAYPTNVTTNSARTESGFLQNSGGCPDIYHGFELSLSQLALPAGTYTISARAQHPVTAQTITLPLSGSLATTVTIPASSSAPSITYIEPFTISANRPNTTIDIIGIGFMNGAQIESSYQGGPRTGIAPTLVNATSVRFFASGGLTAGSYRVWIRNPDGQISLPLEGFSYTVTATTSSVSSGNNFAATLNALSNAINQLRNALNGL